jgi:hypothetical protein
MLVQYAGGMTTGYYTVRYLMVDGCGGSKVMDDGWADGWEILNFTKKIANYFTVFRSY